MRGTERGDWEGGGGGGVGGMQVVEAGRAVVLEEVPGWDEVLLGGVATPCEGDRGVTGREEVG